jgi:hypothetical protein
MIHLDNFIESFQRLEFRRHVALSLGALACITLVGYWIHVKQYTGLVNARAEIQVVQNELKTRNAAAKLNGINNIENTNPKKTFAELLSSNSKSDEVVREMSRLAAGKGIGLESLKIAPSAATASELGKVQYNVTMKTDYYLFKGWLGSLLSRYPALGVNTLSIRGIAVDNAKQDINLSLLLYVKD